VVETTQTKQSGNMSSNNKFVNNSQKWTH